MLVVLTACGAPQAVMVPPEGTPDTLPSNPTLSPLETQAATPAPPPASAEDPTAPAATPAPPTATVEDSASSAAVMASAELQFPALTPTPPFPEQHITAETLPLIQRLRTVGYGLAHDAAFSPSQPLVAVATSAGVVLLELPGLRQLRFDPITAGAAWVAFSDDGRELLVTTGTHQNPQQLERRQVSDGHLFGYAAPAPQVQPQRVLSPSGEFEAVFRAPDTVPTPGVTLRRVADGTTVYDDAVTRRVVFSPDSRQAALLSYRGAVRVLDLATGALVEVPFPVIRGAAFSPDGLRLATVGYELQLLDVVTGQQLQLVGDVPVASASGLLDASQRIRYSPDGGLLTVDGAYTFFESLLRSASTWRESAAGLTHAWDIEAGGVGITNYETYTSAISPASAAAAWTTDGATITVRRSGLPQLSLASPNSIGALAFSPDGALLAISDEAGQVQLVQVADGTQVRSITVEGGAREMVFSPDGAQLGIRSAAGPIMVWQIAGQGPLLRIDDAEQGGRQLPFTWPHDRFLFSADGSLLIAWGLGDVRFYRLSDGQLVHSLAVAAEEVAIGPRGRMLALVRNGMVELWGIP